MPETLQEKDWDLTVSSIVENADVLVEHAASTSIYIF
jgi:hypothetical protein